MSRKSIFGALAVAAGVSAAVAVKLYKDTRKRHEEKKMMKFTSLQLILMTKRRKQLLKMSLESRMK